MLKMDVEEGDEEESGDSAKTNRLRVTSKAQVQHPANNRAPQGKNLQAQPTNSQQLTEQQVGKENHNEWFCFQCNRSLARSRQLINIAGRMHRWHPECFKCDVCNHPLDRETSCHVYMDKIVCRDDYAKLQRDNSIKCSRCRWPIAASDWVRRAGEYVYHLACFSCDICMRQLSTGEQFALSIQEKTTVKLFCRLHFAIEPARNRAGQSGEQSNAADTDSRNNDSGHANLDRTSQSPFEFNYTSHSPSKFIQQQNPLRNQPREHDQYMHLLVPTSVAGQEQDAAMANRKEIGPHDSSIGVEHQDEASSSGQRAGTNSTSNSSNGSTSGLLGGLPSKSKRVRTTFTEDQLSYLQTQFQIDSNPDGQDLERIATVTGLSKRVTQVWFQNSRARQKKYMIKRKPLASSSSSSAAAVAAAVAAAASTLPPAPSIGLPASKLSLQPPLFGHQHRQQSHQLHEESSTMGASCYLAGATQQHDQQQQHGKWTRSDLSHSAMSAVATSHLDQNESSDEGELIVSEDEEEREEEYNDDSNEV